MFSDSYSSAILGMEACVIHVEADVSDGLPIFQLVGFLASEVKEAKERVRISIRNSGYKIPAKRITVNLSPADIHKEGTAFDLAIACAVLSGLGILMEAGLKHTMLIGELGLNGNVCAVNGVLPIIYEAKKQGFSHAIVPYDNRREAGMVEGIEVLGAKTLSEAVGAIQRIALGEPFCMKKADESGKEPREENRGESKRRLPGRKYCEEKINSRGETVEKPKECLDFADVYGQELLKRAVEVAAAGMHNLLISGPPGTGKSMIAKRIPGILPEPDFSESMEISKIYSIAGLLDKEQFFITERPFRSPHHSITESALVGGGRYPKPGEVSLANGGVLFLDELAEFPRRNIELLRQPLEDGYVTIARLSNSYRYPCHTMVVGAMNPCPCGFYPDRNRCRCTTAQIRRYQGKLSQPFLERMDLCVEAVPVNYEEIHFAKEYGRAEKGNKSGKVSKSEKIDTISKIDAINAAKKPESTENIRRRVCKAQEIQKKRFFGSGIHYNSEMNSRQVERYCPLEDTLKVYMKEIYVRYEFSMRACHKLLKVARTIADLSGAEEIQREHLEEAFSYRMFRLDGMESEVV